MRRLHIISLLLCLIIPANTLAQRDSLRHLFTDAESWFHAEEYREASSLYAKLLLSDPANSNLKYKLGICLLNDPYRKERSIPYLLEASQNMDPNSKEGSFKETSAPPDALFYLGNAYLVNEMLDKALETYREFLEVLDPDVYDADLVQEQIRICHNAKELMAAPVDLDLILLDSLINTRYADIQPVLSGDGKRMAFVTRLPFYDGAFVTDKTEEGWSYPQPITQSLGFDSDVYPVALSYDGTEMILYYDDAFTGNLYYSRFENGRWNVAKKMGGHISTRYWESSACFSKDGQTLYFTSNRKGSYGGLDIYQSKRLPDGQWDSPENLGPTINSPYNEESPSISEDGSTLYFSSYGHYNMGGYDIFYSRKKSDGTWGEPVNMGYPINTTDNDVYFQPLKEGEMAYHSIYSAEGIGLHDIYRLKIYSEENPRIYSVSGILRTEDSRMEAWKHAIFVCESETGDTLIQLSPETKSGRFRFSLPKGNYSLHFKGTGYQDLLRSLQINAHSEKSGIQLKDDIVQFLDEIPETAAVKDSIPIALEPVEQDVMEEAVPEPRPKIESRPDVESKLDLDTTSIAGPPAGVDSIGSPEPEMEEAEPIGTQQQEDGKRVRGLLPLALVAILALLWFLILWLRRRKRE